MAWIELKAADGHELQAWESRPAGTPRGCIVVLQEIFGVTAHIRSVCDRYAAQGWLALAPALFDRVARGCELVPGPEGVAQGRAAKEKITDAQALADVQAAIAHLRPQGKVAVVGFCWGGTLAWLAAAHLHGVACVVPYYGTAIHAYRNEKPRVPVLMHFGAQDTNIPPAQVDDIARDWPELPLHRYDAGHGFNRDGGPAFHPASAQLAATRTGQFLTSHLC